jgi:nitroimidazol reductase NimA-like FMN-containing flavoprotein (pyridoxamine 5'-phosphate oxidase superfamily)
MPGYGIADAKGGKGLLPWRWAEERLENGRTYFLATSDPTGKPHAMPVWGVWFSDSFFFSTGNQSRKSRNLSANARCSVAMEVAYGPRPKKGQVKDAVVFEGTAELVTDARTRKKFSVIYEDKYAWDMEGFNEPVFRVRPQVVFGLTSNMTETATRWRFEQ